MVEFVEIQTLSYVVAALSFAVTCAYYIMNLRMVQKKMAVDAALLYGKFITDKESVLDWSHFLFETEFTSFEEGDKKYRSKPKELANLYNVVGNLNQLGLLMKEKIVEPEMLWTLITPI